MVSLFRLAGAMWAVLVLGGLLALGGCDAPEEAERTDRGDTADARSAPVFEIRSVTLDARNRPPPDLLPRLRDLGVTHLTLVSFGWQEAADTPTIRTDTSDGWYSESHRGIRTLARQADSLGMDVILKPHLWVGGYDETQSRSDIGFGTEAGWERWEADYRAFLMLYARLAERVEADVLVLGTELTRSARERPAFWRGLADSVRTVYDGDLTYAANWHRAYEEVRFWDALDYVGVQAYFPLTDTKTPALDTLRAAWRTHRQALARIHERTGQPVLLTEVGYRSAPTTAAAPWRWPEQEAVPPDTALQAQCYRAFFSTMAPAPWLKGAILWKWHPPSEVERATGFTPQGKAAEAVIRRWFTRPAAR
jgi:hypothetical protein